MAYLYRGDPSPAWIHFYCPWFFLFFSNTPYLRTYIHTYIYTTCYYGLINVWYDLLLIGDLYHIYIHSRLTPHTPYFFPLMFLIWYLSEVHILICIFFDYLIFVSWNCVYLFFSFTKWLYHYILCLFSLPPPPTHNWSCIYIHELWFVQLFPTCWSIRRRYLPFVVLVLKTSLCTYNLYVRNFATYRITNDTWTKAVHQSIFPILSRPMDKNGITFADLGFIP